MRLPSAKGAALTSCVAVRGLLGLRRSNNAEPSPAPELPAVVVADATDGLNDEYERDVLGL